MFKPFGKKPKSTRIQALHEPTEEQLKKFAGVPKAGNGNPVWPRPPKLKPVKFPKPRRG